jgi:hypothetical protein
MVAKMRMSLLKPWPVPVPDVGAGTPASGRSAPLREMEGPSYRERADVIGIPIGAVMWRLARARGALRGALDEEITQSGISSRRSPREQEAEAVLV